MAASGSTVALAFGSGDAIYFAVSHDSGERFSVPVKVAEAPIVPLTHHRGPKIAFAGRAIVITAVIGKIDSHKYGKPVDGNLIAWRSTDGGKTWSKGAVVNDVPGAPDEGLHGLASDGNRLFAVWLDRRGNPDAVTLYGSQSDDGGRTWSRNVRIYQSPGGSICTCCDPSVKIGADGEIVVMFRNDLDGSRDLYLARSRDGVNFSQAEKLGFGTWKIDACPMDGGGLAFSQGRIVTAWRRGEDIFLDVPGEKETLLAPGKDIAVSSAGKGLYAIWSSISGIQVMVPGKSRAIGLASTGSLPAIAALPAGGAIAAWDDNGQITIRQIP